MLRARKDSPNTVLNCDINFKTSLLSYKWKHCEVLCLYELVGCVTGPEALLKIDGWTDVAWSQAGECRDLVL